MLKNGSQLAEVEGGRSYSHAPALRLSVNVILEYAVIQAGVVVGVILSVSRVNCQRRYSGGQVSSRGNQ